MQNKIKHKPLVSIIMPTYNRANIIEDAVKSVLGQTRKNFELLIINDGSTDNTSNIIKKNRDKRIIYLENKKNYGPAKARNIGLKAAKGAYIAYCDDDCIYYSDHISNLVNFLETNPDIAMAYSDALVSMPGEKPFKLNRDFDKRLLETNRISMLWSTMHRKCYIHRIGAFDEKLIVAEDWDMWLRISDAGKIARLPVITVKHVYYDRAKNTLAGLRLKGIYTEYLIKKRIAKVKKENRYLEYINDCSIGVIKNLIDNGRLKYAYNLTKEFLEIKESYQTIACNGLCNFGSGRFYQALCLFKKSLSNLPRYWQRLQAWDAENIITIKVFLARTYSHFGKTTEAIKICKDALEIMPDKIETSIELARCFTRRNFYSKTLQLLKSSFRNPAACNLRGYCYFKQKKYSRAIREFKNALLPEPNITMYRYNLATVYAKMGAYTKAIEEYKRILAIQPNHRQAKQMVIVLKNNAYQPKVIPSGLRNHAKL